MPPESAPFVVNIPRIDREHETLVEFIEQAESICDVGNPDGCGRCTLTRRDHCFDSINTIVAALATYMLEHFRYEDQLMDDSISDDQALQHRLDHVLLFERLQDVTDELARENALAVSAQTMINVLGNWIEYHFYEYDAVLAASIGTEDDKNADPTLD